MNKFLKGLAIKYNLFNCVSFIEIKKWFTMKQIYESKTHRQHYYTYVDKKEAII